MLIPKQRFGFDQGVEMIKICLLCISFVLIHSVWLDANSSLKSYKDEIAKHHYKKAKKILEPLAKDGDSQAQYILATTYQDGKGVSKDIKKAILWHKKASNGGNLSATKALAILYYLGAKDLPKDANMSFGYYLKAARKGDRESAYNVGYMYENGFGSKRDISKAIYWYNISAKSDFVDAKFRLATLYYTGLGIKKDINKAIYWYREAGADGDKEALYNLGVLYYQGIDIPMNKIYAYHYWIEAAKRSHKEAQNSLDRLCKESIWACK